MKVNDSISGALVLALAVFVYLEAGTFRTMPGVPYGPGLFPRMIALVLALAGAFLIANGLRERAAQGVIVLADWARNPRSYLLFATVVGGALAFALLAPRLGFIIAAFLMLSALLLVARGVRHAGSSLVVAVIAVAATHVMFAKLLRVPLPFGLLEALIAG